MTPTPDRILVRGLEVSAFIGVNDHERIMLSPTGIGVRVHHFAGSHSSRNFLKSNDIGVWVFPHFYLKLIKAFGSVFANPLSHTVRISARNDFEQLYPFLKFSTEKMVNGLVHGFSKNVPTRHINC